MPMRYPVPICSAGSALRRSRAAVAPSDGPAGVILDLTDRRPRTPESFVAYADA